MRILIIGSGGREHAIVWALRKSDPTLKLYCAPGNAGIAENAQCVPIGPAEQDALIKFARSEEIDLTVVGPEAPLVDGIVDEFNARGLAIFGPSRHAARLEGSKAFAKNFMARNGIPTAAYAIAHSPQQALEILRGEQFGLPDGPVVIKADGLAAGKGVIVANSRIEGVEAVETLTDMGLAGPEKSIVIEEALGGKEASILILSDGRDYVLMPPARDHKRIGENETGPNTGGMGSITDPSIVDNQTLDRIVREIVEPTLEASRKEGFPYKGVLFFGLMLTANGPKVLEYNVRFGDPETQAILVRLNTDLVTLFRDTNDGQLGRNKVDWTEGASACVVLANRGYPGSYETGAVINGLAAAVSDPSVQIFHAGTGRSRGGDFIATGGRVLGVAAGGGSLPEALSHCYSAVDKISWAGMQFRPDIGRF